jgi:uncharacterized membrane protein HdeD (DUF308 family)
MAVEVVCNLSNGVLHYMDPIVSSVAECRNNQVHACTLALEGSMNRWVNIVVGIAFAGFGLLNFADPAMHTGHQILIGIALFVAPVLIVWYALKWPKQEA